MMSRETDDAWSLSRLVLVMLTSFLTFRSSGHRFCIFINVHSSANVLMLPNRMCMISL